MQPWSYCPVTDIRFSVCVSEFLFFIRTRLLSTRIRLLGVMSVSKMNTLIFEKCLCTTAVLIDDEDGVRSKKCSICVISDCLYKANDLQNHVVHFSSQPGIDRCMVHPVSIKVTDAILQSCFFYCVTNLTCRIHTDWRLGWIRKCDLYTSMPDFGIKDCVSFGMTSFVLFFKVPRAFEWCEELSPYQHDAFCLKISMI